jgi:hypothetical protein
VQTSAHFFSNPRQVFALSGVGTDMKNQITFSIAVCVLTLAFSAAASAQTQTQATNYCTQGNATSSSCSFTALPSTGDFILIQGQRWATAGTVTDCSDNQGNTYAVAVQSPLAAGVISAFICYATNIGTPSGTFTVTVSSGNTSYWNLKATSWSGMATSSALDVTAMDAGSGTTASSGATGALAQSNNLVAASVGLAATQTSITVESLSPAWTEQFEELDANLTLAGEADTRVISSSSAQTANWTTSTSHVWSAVIAVFKGSSCAGGVSSDGSDEDTQSKITNAAPGGVVCVPAGNYTWDQTVEIPDSKGITVRGAGIGVTNITVSSSLGGNRRAFDMMVTSGNALSRITGFTIDHGFAESCGVFCSPIAVIGQGVDSFRVDNNRLEGVSGTGVLVLGTSLGVQYPNGAEVSGLIDHNEIVCHPTTFTGCHPTVVLASPPWDGPSSLSANLAAGWGEPFTRAVSLGSNKSIYIEDNTFDLNGLYQDGLLDTFGGAQVVFRYNVADGSAPGNHGFDSAGYRGPRWLEVYGNTLNLGADNPNCGAYRGGILLYFDNICDPPSTDVRGVALQIFRARGALTSGIDIFFTAHGPCDGENNGAHTVNVDGNAGSGTNTVAAYPSIGTGGNPGWPCLDQVGWHFDADGGAGYEKRPTYFWNNDDGMGSHPVVGNYESDYGNLQNYMKCNRDYYLPNTSFNGAATVGNCSTGGVGRGTFASRPSTCTVGVAYWATDAGGNWKTDNASSNDGALYACTSTDTWTLYYTPYQYPHPLAN